MTRIVSVLLTLAAGLAAADTEYLSIDQLPAPVQKTLLEQAKGAKLGMFEKGIRGEVTTFSAEIPGAKAGTIVELTVAPDGRLLKSEIEDIGSEVPAVAGAITSLGDLTTIRAIGVETLHLVVAKDLPGAAARITDLESAWDAAEPSLRAKNGGDWKILDKAIDKALSQMRADKPDPEACTKTLRTMIGLCPVPAAPAK